MASEAPTPKAAISPDPIMAVYKRAPIAFERGEGVRLFGDDGETYLDCIAGIAVNALGHCHPKLVSALETQARKLWHVSNVYSIPEQEALARRLTEVSFADVCFFTNSGTEAVECALKLARKYHASKGQPERIDIIAFDGSFHGRTYAAIYAAGNPSYVDGFGPALPGYVNLPFGDEDALREAAGKLFAYEWADNAQPDVMMLAKALGGGFPVGACLATTEAASGMTVGTHGSTYGGNPLAMAVSLAALEELVKPELLQHVVDLSGYFTQQLEGLKASFPDVIVDVRGKGLLIGIKLIPNNRDFMVLAREQRLLVAGGGDNCIRLLPPLILTQDDAREAIEKLERTCAAARAQAQAAAVPA
jgi:acetylornithine/N-succinyldiaminopimelate aminotransferase